MTEFYAPWVESFEQAMADAYNAAERIKLDLSEDGFATWVSSPEVRALWDHANSGVGNVSITFTGCSMESVQ